MSRAPYVSIRVTPTGRRATAADIVAAVERELAAGGLPVGSRLPPVRVLEQQLGLSKNTAQVAYDELGARGLVETRAREGVFIAAPVAGVAPVAPMISPPLPLVRPPPMVPEPRRPGLAIGTVFIDPELLPSERLAECARAVLKQPGLATHYDPQGFAPLREQIAQRLVARGLDVEADEVIVTTGSQQALDIVARALEVRRVAIETPVYAYAKHLFETLGLAITGLRLDPFAGLDLAAWDRALAAARPGLLYAITSFQNPTGYSYTSHELRGVLDLCARHGVAIVEDDWGSDMLSGSEYRPMLRALGGTHVVYVNSFTKKLLPSLRVGFAVADRAIVPSLLAMKRLSTLGNVWLSEAVVGEFLARGYYDGHLAQLQRELDLRYAACLAALTELMPAGVRWTTPGGGPTLWLELPAAVPVAALAARVARHGVIIDERSAAFVGLPHLNGFRVGYAAHPPDALARGLAITAEAIAALLQA
jgi:GntR family transcriptional regulator/MocR family aminotransferase